MIRTLMGLEKPKTGKISINGSYSGKQQRRKKSFYVMQDVDYQLFAPNVLEEMLMGTKKTEIEKEQAICKLENLGLGKFLKRHPQLYPVDKSSGFYCIGRNEPFTASLP